MCSLSRFIASSIVATLLSCVAQAAPFAYITNGISETVSVIDTATNTTVATVRVGSAPMGVAVNPNGTRVYVANFASNSISVIDTATNAVTATVTLGGSPLGVAVSPSGTHVYATTVFSNNITVIDARTHAVVATLPTGTTPGGLAVSPSGTRVYVAITGTAREPGTTILVIDAATHAAIGSVAVGLGPSAVAVNPVGTLVYATVGGYPGSVAVIDAASDKVVASVPVVGAPMGVAVSPSGERVYVSDAYLDNVLVIDAATHAVIATVPVGVTPTGVAVTPAGTRVYVANFDSDDVSVIDTATNTVIATVPVGIAPVALGQFIGPAIPGPSGSDTVVEYYHAGLDHYFITWMPNEIAILDAGTQIRGWTRTGHSFKTYTTAHVGTSPVCRYYIPPGLGDSHFFGRGTVECNATGQKNPTFVLEDPAFMQTFLPAAGACPANTTQVYRVFSNRPDANHRYMTDRVVRDQMVTKGWLAEGDGPELVVMCAPL